MISGESHRSRAGQYSPLRYPGGKGKIARFMRDIVQANGLDNGHYVEPYAGGAGVAWELLLTGVVKRVSINDINLPVFAFWNSVLRRTDDLCRLISDCPVTMDEWHRQKHVVSECKKDCLELGFACFFLNRTNRSGILGGGVIGGHGQSGKWKIDARFNKPVLLARIEGIAQMKSRISVERKDAMKFLQKHSPKWRENTLVYIDPPYYEKGRSLYYDAYNAEDHHNLARDIGQLKLPHCVISYDDVKQIRKIYRNWKWLRYSMNYTAQSKGHRREAMFFSDKLSVPRLPAPFIEIRRGKARPRR